MSIPTFTIDVFSNSAVLNLFNEEVLVSSYEYENSEVTLSERPSTLIVGEGLFEANVGLIEKWIKLIILNLSVVYLAFEDWETSTNVGNPSLTGKFEGDEVLSQLSYDSDKKEFTFLSRPEQTIPFTLFLRWAKFLRQFSDDAKRVI